MMVFDNQMMIILILSINIVFRIVTVVLQNYHAAILYDWQPVKNKNATNNQSHKLMILYNK